MVQLKSMRCPVLTLCSVTADSSGCSRRMCLLCSLHLVSRDLPVPHWNAVLMQNTFVIWIAYINYVYDVVSKTKFALISSPLHFLHTQRVSLLYVNAFLSHFRQLLWRISIFALTDSSVAQFTTYRIWILRVFASKWQVTSVHTHSIFCFAIIIADTIFFLRKNISRDQQSEIAFSGPTVVVTNCRITCDTWRKITFVHSCLFPFSGAAWFDCC
jgi:hypothetical protein